MPFAPTYQELDIQKLHIHQSDNDVRKLLGKSKIVAIPANYESFGIAQLEAILSGCIVPILGYWPLWERFKEMRFENHSTEEVKLFCQQIRSDETLRLKMLHKQLCFLRSHPITKTDFMPGLIS